MSTVVPFRRRVAALSSSPARGSIDQQIATIRCHTAAVQNKHAINRMIATLIRIDPAEQDNEKLSVLQHSVDMLTVPRHRQRQPLRVATIAAACMPIDNYDFAVGFQIASNRLAANGGTNGTT